jgi:hypothetical protein
MSETLGQRVWRSAILLFFAGLVVGFAAAMPNLKGALTAHLTAVQSAPFLAVLGLLWPRLNVWPRAAWALAHLLIASFWILAGGLLLRGLWPADASPGLAAKAPGLIILLGSALMLLSVGAVLASFGRRPEPAS